MYSWYDVWEAYRILNKLQQKTLVYMYNTCISTETTTTGKSA